MTLERVIGHRDTGRTACPGELLYDQLDELRALVASGVGVSPTFTTRLSATLADFSVDYGDVVPVTGLLSGPDGGPLVNETVEVQTNGDGPLEDRLHRTTAPDGTFAMELRPRKRLYVRLRYPRRRRAAPGDLVALAAPPAAADHAALAGELERRRCARAGQRAGSARASACVTLVLHQRLGGRYRRVGARAVRVRRGRFSTSFCPPSARATATR